MQNSFLNAPCFGSVRFLLPLSFLLIVAACQQPNHQPTRNVIPNPTQSPSKHSFIGLPIELASSKADKQQLRWRIVNVDGQSRPVTKDYRPNRLNFSVNKGIVTQVTKG